MLLEMSKNIFVERTGSFRKRWQAFITNQHGTQPLTGKMTAKAMHRYLVENGHPKADTRLFVEAQRSGGSWLHPADLGDD